MQVPDVTDGGRSCGRHRASCLEISSQDGRAMDRDFERVASWGRSLCEGQRDPVLWAGGVLRNVAEVLGLGDSADVQSALCLISERGDRRGARIVFDQIRQRRLDRGNPPDATEDQLLRLAEIVAKLAHNASGETPQFDYDAGWQVGPIVYRIASETPGLTCRDYLASVLGGWPTRD